jgi:hypothetical protein
LHLGNHLQGQRGLAGRFRAVDLDDAAARQAAHAQGNVQAQRAGGDDLDVFDHLAFTQAHDGALAELLSRSGPAQLARPWPFRCAAALAMRGVLTCVHENLLVKINRLKQFILWFIYRLDA